jgi:hypothetical protein
MPTSAKAPGSMCAAGNSSCAARPNAPPNMPPMATLGPKSPALPPDPTVAAVASIFTSARPTNN